MTKEQNKRQQRERKDEVRHQRKKEVARGSQTNWLRNVLMPARSLLTIPADMEAPERQERRPTFLGER